MRESFLPFTMERWQSTWENAVALNLAESGVHPLSVGELLQLAGDGPAAAGLQDVRLGYGWSNGTPLLRERIAALYGGDISPDRIAVTNGSAEANLVALWELVEPGSEALVVMPAYMQAAGLIPMLGGTLRPVWVREALGWQPDPDEIRRAVTDRTGLIVVTNPGNPTGAVLSADARRAVLEAAERSGAWILADEVYAGAELEGGRTPSFLGLAERVVATGSLSKAYGLPGLRLGWAVAPAAFAARLWARTDYTTIAHGPLTEYLATLALEPETRDRILDRSRRILRGNIAIVDDVLGGVTTFRRPDAGAIVWLRYAPDVPSAELAERLRAEHDVLVVPGSQFDMEGYLRVGYGGETGALREGLSRVRAALDAATAPA